MPSDKNQESAYVGDEISNWLQDSADELERSKSALLGKILEEACHSVDGEIIESWDFEIELEGHK